MNLEWTINRLQSYVNYQGYTDVVFQVFWQLVATEEVNGKIYTAGSNDITVLTLGEITSFTPYDQLTKEQVVEWIINSINYPALTAALQQSLQEQITPTVVTLPLPWN